MAKRVTVMIDDEHDKTIRDHQIKIMSKENKSYSYSQSLNDILSNKI